MFYGGGTTHNTVVVIAYFMGCNELSNLQQSTAGEGPGLMAIRVAFKALVEHANCYPLPFQGHTLLLDRRLLV